MEVMMERLGNANVVALTTIASINSGGACDDSFVCVVFATVYSICHNRCRQSEHSKCINYRYQKKTIIPMYGGVCNSLYRGVFFSNGVYSTTSVYFSEGNIEISI